jgi:SAM-dependent methyltransferase
MIYYRLFSKIYETGAKRMCSDCQDFIERGCRILDLGCGSGIAALKFRDFFEAEVVGADIQDDRIVNIPFKIFDGKTLPFKNDSFDITLMNYVLHHCTDPERLLKEAKRVSRKIIIFEDLPEGFFAKLRCKLHQLTFFGGGRGKFNFKTSKEWESLFQRLNFKIIAKKRVFADFDWLDPVKRILFVLGQ